MTITNKYFGTHFDYIINKFDPKNKYKGRTNAISSTPNIEIYRKIKSKVDLAGF